MKANVYEYWTQVCQGNDGDGVQVSWDKKRSGGRQLNRGFRTRSQDIGLEVERREVWTGEMRGRIFFFS